jgi:hypothetical protein
MSRRMKLSWVAVVALVIGSGGALAFPVGAIAGSSGAGDCIAHHFGGSVWYTSGCSGHDEPELDPVSSLSGSARDLAWTAILPSDGSVPVSAVGPTFWWGGTVTDPNPHALFHQAFLEVQFYPDALVNNCSSDGGFNVRNVPDDFTVCTPVWQVSDKSGGENAAFNAMLTDASVGGPLVMHGGDVITIHFFMASPNDGWHITVADRTTGHSGTVVLDSGYGPLQPAFSTQQIGNALGWGIVDDTPNAFVWEIGHTSPFTNPASQFCLPGQTNCDSYDIAHWLGFHPLQILGVTFANGSAPQQWAVVSDFGGKAEVDQYCPTYGTAYCSYPWYTSNSAGFITYGVDYPATKNDYGQADQFAQSAQCGGPFGADSTYCDTVLHPNP